eukprot:TRINITY_DN9610_c0_g1_i2.p1 TRINITY_DN9610_c0_g1~~TRINITY_DN9610_c0_g1_i2.p1  ORF type:complete len:114 (-),score=6.39 TRINITY_DN9610_c0_g1_i2:187-528(-)
MSREHKIYRAVAAEATCAADIEKLKKRVALLSKPIEGAEPLSEGHIQYYSLREFTNAASCLQRVHVASKFCKSHVDEEVIQNIRTESRKTGSAPKYSHSSFDDFNTCVREHFQ